MNGIINSLDFEWIQALGVKLPRKLAMCLTLVQLSEMFIGIAVNIYNLRQMSKCKMNRFIDSGNFLGIFQ